MAKRILLSVILNVIIFLVLNAFFFSNLFSANGYDKKNADKYIWLFIGLIIIHWCLNLFILYKTWKWTLGFALLTTVEIFVLWIAVSWYYYL